jgi:L-threonylcarbamoyladenylate synthase
MNVIKQSQKAIDEAVNTLKKKGVVICPTDTVYGFLADGTNKKAVEKIYKIKKRAKSKPLPVFIKDFKMAKKLAEIDTKQKKTLERYWPGKYTFVLKRKPGVKIYGVDKDTIALRIPKYKFLNNLLNKINKPLVQTSVNISGNPALIRISDIINQFSKTDILIVNAGDMKNNKSSKILDLTKNKVKILRK